MFNFSKKQNEIHEKINEIISFVDGFDFNVEKNEYYSNDFFVIYDNEKTSFAYMTFEKEGVLFKDKKTTKFSISYFQNDKSKEHITFDENDNYEKSFKLFKEAINFWSHHLAKQNIENDKALKKCKKTPKESNEVIF